MVIFQCHVGFQGCKQKDSKQKIPLAKGMDAKGFTLYFAFPNKLHQLRGFILLMEEILHPRDILNLVNNGINYTYQQVSWISEPSTVPLPNKQTHTKLIVSFFEHPQNHPITSLLPPYSKRVGGQLLGSKCQSTFFFLNYCTLHAGCWQLHHQDYFVEAFFWVQES